MEKEYEYQVDIDGTVYAMSDLTSGELEQPLLDSFSVGNACSAEFVVSYYYYPEPKRMAKVIPYARAKNSNDKWTQLGVFFVDVREEKSGLKTLTCYDSMMKADQRFLKEGDVGEWPRSQSVVAQQIAEAIGVEIDSRTYIESDYVVEYPNEDTMRTVLQNIAAANGGNWIITAQNKLLLIPLFTSMPAETSFLVTESGDAILFGDTRILV